MKALCLYVDGGKGHYVPLKAVEECLNKLSVETYFEEFFEYFDIEWIGSINKFYWRTMLKHPNAEQRLSKHNDANSNGMELAINYAKRHLKRVLESNLEEDPVDFIFATHPYASTIIAEMLSYMKIDIPVYYYATDVFNAPVASISDKLDGYLISTAEGLERVKKMGQREESLFLVPFPLQSEVANSQKLSKTDARRKTGLDESLFTVQLNLGGEGIGSLSVLEDLDKSGKPVQVVVIGGIDGKTKKRLLHIAEKTNSNLRIHVRGFINDVSTYLAASDVIVGRAGINTIVEAIYAHRPFLITELVYTVIPSADFIEKYKVGWNASEGKHRASEILFDLIDNPHKLEEIDKNFNRVPIEFNAIEVARKLVELAERHYEEQKKYN